MSPVLRLPVCLLLLVSFFTCAGAQERRGVSSGTWTAKDTSEIIALAARGIVLTDRNLDSALVIFGQMERLSRQTGFDDGTGYALSYIALIQSRKGNTDTAFRLYRRAFPYCVQARYLKGSAGTLYANIGSSYLGAGNYALAGYWYRKSLELARLNPAGRDYTSVIYHNLASVHFRMKEYDRALHYARKAEMLEVASGGRNRAFMGSLYASLGAIYGMQHMLDTAGYYFAKALVHARAAGARYIEQNILNNAGNLLLATGRPGEALAYYQQALQLTSDTSQLHGFILPSYSIGECLTALGRYNEAEMYLLRALGKAASTGLAANKQKGHKILSELYRKTGRYSLALQQRDLHDRLNDSLTGLERTRVLAEAEARYRLEEKDRIIAQHNLKMVRQQQDVQQGRLLLLLLAGGFVVTGIIVAVSMRSRRKIGRRSRELMHLQAVMAGQENERERIAQELHDGIGSMLTALKLEVSALKQHPEPSRKGWDALTEAIGSISEEVHKTARNLTPGVIQQYDLWQALVNYCELFEGKSDLHIDLQSAGDLEDIPTHVRLTLYRVVQELIQNAVKHSGAGLITVILRREDSRLYLSVEDDGRGFDPAVAAEGLGLSHMHSRIKSLNGYCSISSSEGQGVTAFIEIDLDQIPPALNERPVS